MKSSVWRGASSLMPNQQRRDQNPPPKNAQQKAPVVHLGRPSTVVSLLWCMMCVSSGSPWRAC